jgi:hypothetical protein
VPGWCRDEESLKTLKFQIILIIVDQNFFRILVLYIQQYMYRREQINLTGLPYETYVNPINFFLLHSVHIYCYNKNVFP